MSQNVYIETYGCQMNLNDSEIISAILKESGYGITDKLESADIVLLNTCSVRGNAEEKIFNRLNFLKHRKKKQNLMIGVIGCMAERLQEHLLENGDTVDIVIGPDEYRNAPALIQSASTGARGVAVNLSTVETYDDIIPLRKDGFSAWISIMRGCNNFCSYCIVPYTRGRERSKPLNSILSEISKLKAENFKEYTLLGQNVNSYKDEETEADFADLLESVAKISDGMRIRFVTSHPKDLSDKLIEVMSENSNICKSIHLPLQSGSNNMLKQMNRKYTYEHYLGRINKIREYMPGCGITTDIIAGYPGETIEAHEATLKALENIQYDGAFMFRYSPREGTKAYDVPDDVPEEEKLRRLNEIIHLQQKISKNLNKSEIGNVHEVLAEGPSKRNKDEWQGRSDTNKIVIFPYKENIKPGNIIKVKITRSTSATLFGEIEN